MPSVLLHTKLRCPSLPARRVNRPQLVARLVEGYESGRQITLVSAPAGFGKTICVVEWLQELSLPVSWLSLDPSDNDPARFFAYFIAALQKAYNNIGREIEQALRSGQLAPGESISTALINDLLQVPSPFLLVLDDFHVIQNRSVLDFLEQLATNLPPCLFLVLLTREDPSLPLARLRANNQVSEIRAADLRFTRGEIDSFLNAVMGLDLSPGDITSLADRTEGWVVGLQLAALSLKNRENRGEFIAKLSGGQHFILSYLTEEVLRRQSPDIQDFLLETSVLDRLSGPLCNTVTERADSAVVLEQLYASNVFVIPLDEEYVWYRYHHLFADLLRRQLNRTRPEREPILHLRASAWYESQSSPPEAVDHAFAAGDYARVASLLDRYARWMLMQGYAATLEHWLVHLPPEWHVAGPQANLAFVGSLLLRGRLGEVEIYLRHAESAAEERGKAGALAEANRILCEARASRAIYDAIRGETECGIALAQQAVALAPPSEVYLQGLAHFALGTAYHYAAKILPAIEAYQRALPLCQASGNNSAAMLTIANLGFLFMLQGQLRKAADLCVQVIQTAEQTIGAHSPALATVYTNYGAILYEWGDLEAIHRLTEKWLDVSTQGGHVSTMAHDGLVLAQLSQAEGDSERAQATLDEAMQTLQRGAPDWVSYRAVGLQVALALARDDESAAEQALGRTELAAGDPIDEKREVLYIASLRLLHHRGCKAGQEHLLAQALDLANRLLASAEPNGRMGRVIEILTLRALVYQAQGDLTRALEDLCRALSLAEPEGYLRLFVDEGEPMARLLRIAHTRGIQPGYIARLLAPSPQGTSSSPSQTNMIEPLTDRELEVLRLIAEGLSYREIAERLVVSVNTVRFHVKGIYGKLGVENRAAAIAQARTLRLLP